MNTIARRIAAALALTAAPALIALGAATTSHAEGAITNTGPGVSAPQQHKPFPHQHNIPKPGTREHHRHQWNHMK
jgi:hypothetical protein